MDLQSHERITGLAQSTRLKVSLAILFVLNTEAILNFTRSVFCNTYLWRPRVPTSLKPDC